MKPYAVFYIHNRTHREMWTTVWAYSKKDARERFAECEERHEAEKIVAVEREDA